MSTSNWTVELHDDFKPEYDAFSVEVKKVMVQRLKLIEEFGPNLARPYVDTIKGSKHANLKEFRFDADDGVWRGLFAFDLERKAIVLVAGDKSGTSEKRFYRDLIKKAEQRFDKHLKTLKEG